MEVDMKETFMRASSKVKEHIIGKMDLSTNCLYSDSYKGMWIDNKRHG